MTLTASILFDSSAMTMRELRRTVRSIDGLITALLLPVMILLVFVEIFGGAFQADGQYVQYAVPGVIILCVGFGSAATAVSVAMDMKSGTIDRFKTLPMFGPAVLVGHVVASVIRNLLATALVIAVALLLGFRPQADPLAWAGVIGLVLLFAVALTWVACAIGLLLAPEAANSATMVMLFLPYLSSGFVQTATLPGWLQPFAGHQPLTPLIEACRALLLGQPAGNDAWLAVAWFLGIGIVGYAFASTIYRRRTAA